jgi:hypothetical protein
MIYKNAQVIRDLAIKNEKNWRIIYDGILCTAQRVDLVPSVNVRWRFLLSGNSLHLYRARHDEPTWPRC